MTATCQKIIALKYFSTFKFTVFFMWIRVVLWKAPIFWRTVACRHRDHPLSITVFRRDTVSSSGGFHHLSPLHHASPCSLYACLYFKANQLRLQGFILVSSFRRTNQSLVTSNLPPAVSRLSFAHLHALRLAAQHLGASRSLVLELICFPFELVTMEKNASKLKTLF